MSVPALTLAMPLAAEKNALLQNLVDGLDAGSLQWLSGYMAGLAARSGTVLPQATAQAAVSALAAPVESQRLTIVYGTQTGNSRLLAERLQKQAEAQGLVVRSVRASDYPTRELKQERLLYVVISTQGDGDPPDDARGFVDFLRGKRAPRLEQLRFSVLALGDSSYPKYCEVGRVLDERLAELGATRLVARVDCDVEFEEPARAWTQDALAKARTELEPKAPVTPAVALRLAASAPAHNAAYNKEVPFAAEVLANQRITGRGALKDVRHVELSLAGSGLTYEPGDALGVWPHNPPELVEAFLSVLKLDGAAPVARDGRTLPLARWLTEELELTKLSRPFLAKHAELSGNAELKRIASPEGGTALAALLATHQVIDVLREHPASWSAEGLVAALRKLTPRLYSLASSQKRVGEEAHLTVGLVEYDAFGSRHWGAATRYLSTRTGDDKVRVFVEPNERFRLPEDASKDVLMIGPGTGVAPFRAFVQERAEVGARGRNWLFFGEQHFRTQFLYQTEWQAALKKGELHRLDLAFSRDRAEKVYVQHRLREKGRDVFEWLEGGAHVYVCGDARRMAADVHAALADIYVTHGGLSREDAEARLDTLREQRRYQRDVY